VETKINYLNILNIRIGYWDKGRLLSTHETLEDALVRKNSKPNYHFVGGNSSWDHVPPENIDIFEQTITLKLL